MIPRLNVQPLVLKNGENKVEEVQIVLLKSRHFLRNKNTNILEIVVKRKRRIAGVLKLERSKMQTEAHSNFLIVPPDFNESQEKWLISG